MKKILFILTMLFFAVGQSCLMAENDEPFTANVQLKFKTANEVSTKQLRYALFKTPKKANDIKGILETAVGQVKDLSNINAFDEAVAKHNIKFKKSKPNGTFSVRVQYPGMALLITSYDPDDDLSIDDAVFVVMEMKAGQTEYTEVIERKMGQGSQNLQNVDVTGTSKDTATITAAPALDDGVHCYIPISVHMPAGYVSEDSRLVIQPYAVECETGDSVDFVQGLCYEGLKYHELQNRRMGYNYLQNDKLKDYYSDKLFLRIDGRVDIDTTIVYKKRKPSDDYKFPFAVEVADYHHVYYSHWASTTSCTKKNYYKFLNLAVSQADLDTEEFMVEADENFETKNQDIKLRFQVGKSVLIDDAENDSIKNEFLKELKSYGDRLMQVTVEATASPDGGYETNRKLAAGRLDVAYRVLSNGLGKVDVKFTKHDPKVYSWTDVAKTLEDEGNKDKADSLRTAATTGEGAIKALPFYEEYVTPILVSMRRMRCTYRYERVHRMTPEEVRTFYYERKSELLAGKDLLSDGDYYNLFDVIEDKEELDTITELAYKHVTKDFGYENNKFSMYVCNRKAILNMKQGNADLEILRPFINYRSHFVKGKETRRSDVAQKNRREILINQILTYYLKDERDSAQSLMNFWFNKASEQNEPKVEKLRMFINFKDGFMKCVTGQYTPAEQTKYLQDMEEVLSSHKDNRAIFYCEAAQELKQVKQMHLTDARVDSLVNAMDDSNAKKWYMKGIIAARLEALKSGHGGKGYVPDYLAYFHHSFQMEPSYKLLYFKDGQITDELRKTFLYRKKDFDKYVAKFNELVTIHEDESSSQNEEDIDVSGDDDEEVAEGEQPATSDAAASADAGKDNTTPAADGANTSTKK